MIDERSGCERGFNQRTEWKGERGGVFDGGDDGCGLKKRSTGRDLEVYTVMRERGAEVKGRGTVNSAAVQTKQ